MQTTKTIAKDDMPCSKDKAECTKEEIAQSNLFEKNKQSVKRAKKKKKSKKSKILNFSVKFRLGKKQYEIDFKYNVDSDNPQIIANEMKVLLKLPDDKINEIKKQIEKFVE